MSLGRPFFSKKLKVVSDKISPFQASVQQTGQASSQAGQCRPPAHFSATTLPFQKKEIQSENYSNTNVLWMEDLNNVNPPHLYHRPSEASC